MPKIGCCRKSFPTLKNSFPAIKQVLSIEELNVYAKNFNKEESRENMPWMCYFLRSFPTLKNSFPAIKQVLSIEELNVYAKNFCKEESRENML